MYTSGSSQAIKFVLISLYDHNGGIMALSSYLKSRGIQVSIVFCPIQTPFGIYAFDQMRLSLPCGVADGIARVARDATCIGISVMTKYFHNAVALTKDLKGRLPHVPVLYGGIHATTMPEECTEHADYACVGEGYEPAYELLRSLKAGEKYPRIPGICYRKNGEFTVYPPPPPIEDVDRLPFLDYSLERNYMWQGNAIVPLSHSLLVRHMGFWYTSFFTHGCPYNCSYCCNSFLHDLHPGYKRVRKHSPEYIVDEIQYVRRILPFIRMVKFNDDSFLSLTEDEMDKFSVLKEKLGFIPFVVTGMYPQGVTKQKIGILVRAGLKRVRMGVQTGSQNVLQNIYNRRIDNDVIVRASEVVASFSKELVPTAYDIMVDSPWERPEDWMETLSLINRLKRPFVLNLFSVRLYPGTAIWQLAHREGKIKESILHSSYSRNFFDVQNTYVNGVIALESLLSVPPRLKKYLHDKKLVARNPSIPPFIFKLIFFFVLVKRIFHQAVRRDITMLPYFIARFAKP